MRVPKGKKDAIKAHAEAQGESVNGFINRAIDQVMAEDRRRAPKETAKSTEGAWMVSLSSETEKGQESAQNGEEV